ncbi:hypothetical protein [Sphingobium sp. B2]|uniref:hypothetical protein n=1 Tax=Sphingobium sp. B2 TaxID=2583228 RepID=UPI00119EFBFF|nr:hypothetical protein [Sphingobium sp. B2]
MATAVNEEVLEILSGWSGPRVVAKPPLKPGGVDPLGLRQVNFDLMDRCIPGLNNAATRLRPYTLVAWAWWKAAELARKEGGELVDPDRLKAYIDRVEVLFTVGHLLEQDFAGLLGSDTLRAEVVGRGTYDFSSPAWQAFRKRRAANTSLMAPVSYGPSAKEGAGLGYLSPRSDGTFAPTAEVMPAVMSFDAQLEGLHDDPCLASLECGEVDVERMQELYEYWAMDDLSDEESEVGRSRLVCGQRAGTIELIESILAEAEGPLRIDQIRWEMALSDTDAVPPGVEPTPASVWRAIQAQQLHRLSLEALLVWLLDTTTTRPHQLGELAEILVEAAELEDGTTFGDWLNDATLNEDGVGDPVVAIEEIEDVRQRERPDLALSGLRIALAVCGEIAGDKRLYDGAADRLPLSRALTRARRIASLPVRDGFEVLLSEWIIGQHLYWAVGRSGDETQRLRLMLDEGGWLAFSSYGNANPTPDRLATLLSLASDARIIAADELDGELVYFPA